MSAFCKLANHYQVLQLPSTVTEIGGSAFRKL